jgi:hypothetical protein
MDEFPASVEVQPPERTRSQGAGLGGQVKFGDKLVDDQGGFETPSGNKNKLPKKSALKAQGAADNENGTSLGSRDVNKSGSLGKLNGSRSQIPQLVKNVKGKTAGIDTDSSALTSSESAGSGSDAQGKGGPVRSKSVAPSKEKSSSAASPRRGSSVPAPLEKASEGESSPKSSDLENPKKSALPKKGKKDAGGASNEKAAAKNTNNEKASASTTANNDKAPAAAASNENANASTTTPAASKGKKGGPAPKKDAAGAGKGPAQNDNENRSTVVVKKKNLVQIDKPAPAPPTADNEKTESTPPATDSEVAKPKTAAGTKKPDTAATAAAPGTKPTTSTKPEAKAKEPAGKSKPTTAVADAKNSNSSESDSKGEGKKLDMKPVLLKKKANTQPGSRAPSRAVKKPTTAKADVAEKPTSESDASKESEASNANNTTATIDEAPPKKDKKASKDGKDAKDSSDSKEVKPAAGKPAKQAGGKGSKEKSSQESLVAEVKEESASTKPKPAEDKNKREKSFNEFSQQYHTSMYAKTTAAADGFYAMGLPSPPTGIIANLANEISPDQSNMTAFGPTTANPSSFPPPPLLPQENTYNIPSMESSAPQDPSHISGRNYGYPSGAFERPPQEYQRFQMTGYGPHQGYYDDPNHRYSQYPQPPPLHASMYAPRRRSSSLDAYRDYRMAQEPPRRHRRFRTDGYGGPRYADGHDDYFDRSWNDRHYDMDTYPPDVYEHDQADAYDVIYNLLIFVMEPNLY